MKLPRWVLTCLITVIVLAVPAAIALWWLNRPGADVSGRWEGTDWRLVELGQSDDGSFEGTYSSTYGKDIGQIKVCWSPRLTCYEGTWSEGTYRFGKVFFRVQRDGSIRGEYSADPACESRPGDPVRQDFKLQKRDAVGGPAGCASGKPSDQRNSLVD